MAVTFRSKSEAGFASITSPTPTEPAAAASGDAIIAFYLVGSGSGAPTLPSGWTPLYNGTQGATAWRVGWVSRGGSAPSYAFTHTGTLYTELTVLALQGAATVTLDSQSAAGSSGNGSLTANKPDAPATTAVAGTSLAVSGGFHFDGSTTSIWGVTGYTIRSRNTLTDDAFIGTKSLVASGSEDPAQATTGSNAAASDFWNGFTVTFTDASTVSMEWLGSRPTPRRPSPNVMY